MVNASGDPVIEAAHIWSDTLTVLKHSASLSCVWTTTTRFKPFRVI